MSAPLVSTAHDTAHDRARRQVDSLVGFGVHALAYAVVNVAVVLTAGGSWTSGTVWGWGIGLLAHGVAVLPATRRAYERWVDATAAREASRRA